jgi:predicted dehydrogenase
MHALAVLDPGHFHAALTLGERHPGIRDEIFVYAPEGPELDDFLALIVRFNQRATRPTAWRPVVRAGARSIERFLEDRPADVAILAGRNDGKMAMMRRLHAAGVHVLADKPWLAGPDGLDDLRHTLAGGALAMELMTGPHEITAGLTRRLVADADVFGGFDDRGPTAPAIEITSVHHLEKTVDGAPLRRPPWFFDVRVQGDGIADIPTHMVDYCQRLVEAAATGASAGLELTGARRWATRVPRDLFARVTGARDFPDDLAGAVDRGDLLYAGNAAMAFRVGAVDAALDTRWDLSTQPGGGDVHRSVVRGRRAEIRVEQGGAAGAGRTLSVWPRSDTRGVADALDRAVAAWQRDCPGVAVKPSGSALELVVPRALDGGHESHFPAVLADFLSHVERGSAPPASAARTLAKYVLLTQASAEARRRESAAG